MQQTRRGGTDLHTVRHAYPSVCAAPNAIPEGVPSCKAPWRFSCENTYISPNRGAFGKKLCNTPPAQIQRQTIKVWHVSYQNVSQSILICVALFLTYTLIKPKSKQSNYVTTLKKRKRKKSCSGGIRTHDTAYKADTVPTELPRQLRSLGRIKTVQDKGIQSNLT